MLLQSQISKEPVYRKKRNHQEKNLIKTDIIYFASVIVWAEESFCIKNVLFIPKLRQITFVFLITVLDKMPFLDTN